MNDVLSKETHSRRAFLRTSVLLSGAALSLPALARPPENRTPAGLTAEDWPPEARPPGMPDVGSPDAGLPDPGSPDATLQRKLHLVNCHTDEVLDVVYWEDGQYIDDHLGQLNYFMRDHRADKSKLMDLNLYDFLYKLYTVLDTDESIHVLSAYRTEKTNAVLRRTSSSVAKRSFHVAGRAIDFYIPGVDNKFIQREARRLILGGVGYYTDAGFVHIDTGYPRHWVSV